MCATLRPPPRFLLFVPLYSPLLFSFCSATHSVSASVEQQQQATCSVEILSTDAADFFHHLSLSLPPSFFLSTLGPLPFAEKKPKANRKLMKSENVVAFSLLCFCYVLFFSVFSSSSICCCRCWFCSIAKHILVTDLFFCSLFSLPACCCCFFCVLFVFHFLKFRLLLFFLLPPPPFYHIVSVFRVNLQVTPSDL